MNRSHLRYAGFVIASASLGALMVFGVSAPAVAATCGTGQILNGGFESPVLSTLVESDIYVGPGGWVVWDPTAPPGWAVIKSLPGSVTPTTEALVWSSTEGGVEIQDDVPANSGDQYAEITGLDVTNTLYQTVDTLPGTVMSWTLAHRSSGGTDVMSVRIGPDLANITDQLATNESGETSTQISDGATWQTWTGSYTVPEGQFSTVFGFHGVSTGSGNSTIGNFIDDIGFVCNQAATDAAGGGAADSGGTDSGGTDSGLAMTGMGLSALIALFFAGALLFAFGTGTFGAKNRLRGAAVDLKVNEQMATVNAALARMDARRRAHRYRRKF